MIANDFFYNELTCEVTNKIIKLMETGEKCSNGYVQWPYSIPILEDNRFVNWSFKVARSATLDKPDIWASAGIDENFEPSIEVVILISKGSHQKKADISYAELFGVVAHEFHHIAQNIETTGQYFDQNTYKKNKMNYYLNPIEIEAFNLGFKAESSVSGENIESIMRRYLSLQELEANQIDLIVDQWLKTDYPVLRKNLETQ